MKYVYIAAPYHADSPEEMERNKQNTLGYCEEAYTLGRMTGEKIVPVTPIVNFPYLDENNPEERAEALKLGLLLMARCDEVWCAGDRVSEGMKGEIRAAMRLEKPVYSMGMEQEKIQSVISDIHPMLDESCCYKHSNEKNYTGQLLVLKSSALGPWALEPENQLWIATHGNGTSPTARGRAVFAENLFDGEKTRFDRDDFCGIAISNRLPDWANEAFSKYQQNLNEQNSEESEEQDYEA